MKSEDSQERKSLNIFVYLVQWGERLELNIGNRKVGILFFVWRRERMELRIEERKGAQMDETAGKFNSEILRQTSHEMKA